MANGRVNKEAVEKATYDLLVALGQNPEREGLKETPMRVAKMYAEILDGARYSNDQLVKMFDKCFDEELARDLVVMGNIPVFSLCEHHLALMYNMEVSVAYIPTGRVIGLSKIARVADMCAKRLQLQERLAEDIAYVIEKITGTDNVMVVIKGEHACMTTRGIKKPGVRTSSTVLHGMFRSDAALRQEVYNLI